LALKNAEPLPTIKIKAIKDTLKALRSFMNECEIFFRDSETAYDAFSMRADGKSLVNRLKMAIAYEELEKQGIIERGYWRRKSR
jgi:2-phospho-L-lactate guanylyltransferase (CobY/MobA/RfbA family)